MKLNFEKVENQQRAYTASLMLNGFWYDVKATCCTDDEHHTHKVYLDVPSPEELGLCEEAPEPSQRGEDPESDKVWRKYNKLEADIRKQVAEHLLQPVMECLFKKYTGEYATVWSKVKYSFSRTCGCRCGCSPGVNARGNRLQRIQHLDQFEGSLRKEFPE